MKHTSTKKLTVTALLMAMNIVMSSFSVPTPVGGMYLNDIIVVAGAVLLEPFYAFMVGGVGAFIGDVLFYPAPMFVSLAVHGLQAVVISLCARKLLKKNPVTASAIGAILGWIICCAGYTLGRYYIYSTPAYALAKIPLQVIQTAATSAVGLLLVWPCGIKKEFDKIIGNEHYSY